MRSISSIEADIAALDLKRRALADEHEAAIKARNLTMLRMFDDENKSFRQISEQVGLSWQTVKTYLFNHGRTVGGRNAYRAQLASLRDAPAAIDPTRGR